MGIGVWWMYLCERCVGGFGWFGMARVRVGRRRVCVRGEYVGFQVILLSCECLICLGGLLLDVYFLVGLLLCWCC